MISNNGSLDANLLLRWLLNDVPAQAKLVDNLLASGDFYRVSDIALIELIYVLERKYKYVREDISNQLAHVLDMKQLRCNRVLFDRAVQIYAAHPKLSFADCLMAVEADLANSKPLYTFDRKLASQSDGLAQLLVLVKG